MTTPITYNFEVEINLKKSDAPYEWCRTCDNRGINLEITITSRFKAYEIPLLATFDGDRITELIVDLGLSDRIVEYIHGEGFSIRPEAEITWNNAKKTFMYNLTICSDINGCVDYTELKVRLDLEVGEQLPSEEDPNDSSDNNEPMGRSTEPEFDHYEETLKLN